MLFLFSLCTESTGPNKAAKNFQSKYPTIRESAVCDVLKKYDQVVEESHTFKHSLEKAIVSLRRGRSLLVGSVIDVKVRIFLLTRFHKGGTYQPGLSTSLGEKHCNNTNGAIKHLEGTIIPYGNGEGQSLGNPVRFALLM